MQALANDVTSSGNLISESLFEAIALDLVDKGYSVQINALPSGLSDILHYHLTNMAEYKFSEAGIGRKLNQQHNAGVRNDQIAWINGESPAGVRWLQWSQALQAYLNRHLFLGLFSFESHFAHYAPGHFYRRHVDAFKGEANRVLSIVTYLNPNWIESDGGELVIYRDPTDVSGFSIIPDFGTVTVFLSEEFEHEVKPARRDRYSIAGWYRLNSSTLNKVDPPR